MYINIRNLNLLTLNQTQGRPRQDVQKETVLAGIVRGREVDGTEVHRVLRPE